MTYVIQYVYEIKKIFVYNTTHNLLHHDLFISICVSNSNIALKSTHPVSELQVDVHFVFAVIRIALSNCHL